MNIDLKISKFNIRVYGLVVDEGNILLTDEFRLGINMTKFPGGGLLLGEGTIDCLKRECYEELGQEIEVIRHFYTTDYFQPTTLLPTVTQLISIYYLIRIEKPYRFKTTNKKFDFEEVIDGAQTFRWVSLKNLDVNELTFPIDKKVTTLLKKEKYFK
jgi:8-oxo-dGTP pyrophosphatase MutT (NUDIX family)